MNAEQVHNLIIKSGVAGTQRRPKVSSACFSILRKRPSREDNSVVDLRIIVLSGIDQ
jgi:hypothetical protein